MTDHFKQNCMTINKRRTWRNNYDYSGHAVDPFIITRTDTWLCIAVYLHGADYQNIKTLEQRYVKNGERLI